jgi:hypothetical protein
LFAAATVVLYWAGSWAQLVPVRWTDQTGFTAIPENVSPAPLQVPSVSQLALERARTLVSDDRYSEALSVLVTVGIGDGARGEVDALRAAIQRELLNQLPDTDAGGAAGSADPPSGDVATR